MTSPTGGSRLFRFSEVCAGIDSALGESSRGPNARLTLASLWLHQGLWAKVLDRDPSHREIVGRMPGMKPSTARAATTAIGVLEICMAAWILSGRRPRTCAAAQTALMLGFNAGALTFARDRLEFPSRLIARNAGFVALAWLAAW